MKNFSLLSILVFGSLLTGCRVGPAYTPPPIEMPCQWHTAPDEGLDTQMPSDHLNWWESLQDPILNSLIEQASERNIDLHLAILRILQARIERKAKKGDYLPHVDASLMGGHFYHNKKALLNQFLDLDSHNRNINFFEFGFDVDWEIDFFGKTAHEIKALDAKVEASEEELCGVWVTLSAEIARNYIELRLAQKRLELLEAHIFSQEETVILTQELVRAGFLDTIDLRQAEEQLGLLKAKLSALELAQVTSIHHLSTLLGKTPGSLFDELCRACPLPQLPFCTPIGIPSDLLRRRPDIRRAERNLAAATEHVGSAVASLFPSFSLKGFVGNIHSHLPSLFRPESLAFLIAPQLLAPVFNSRMLKQDVEYNRIKAQAACFEYQKTVLNALEEAENSIATFKYGKERCHRLLLALESSEKALALMKDLYEKGFKSYLEFLVLNRSHLAAEDQFVQEQANLLFNYISLSKALGGGFSACENSE
ncbi:MAG: efflux transporter outer membrane subunit [Parachlamydiaceae bacterium]